MAAFGCDRAAEGWQCANAPGDRPRAWRSFYQKTVVLSIRVLWAISRAVLPGFLGTTSASGEPSLQPAAAISICTVCPPSFVPRRGVWHGMRLPRRNGIATLVPVRSGPLAGPVSGAEPSRERPRSGRLAGIAIVSLGSALFWCLALAVLDATAGLALSPLTVAAVGLGIALFLAAACAGVLTGR